MKTQIRFAMKVSEEDQDQFQLPDEYFECERLNKGDIFTLWMDTEEDGIFINPCKILHVEYCYSYNQGDNHGECTQHIILDFDDESKSMFVGNQDFNKTEVEKCQK